jgi:hypothetical protein
MEVGRGLVYPHQTMLDDAQIDTSSYVVVKVDMVHDNSKILKLKVPPDDTTLTLRDAITRNVQWRKTSIIVDPSTAASASTTSSQLNTSPASIFPDTQPDQRQMQKLSSIQEQPRPSPIREKSCPSPTLCVIFDW